MASVQNVGKKLHIECSKLQEVENRLIAYTVWFCSACCELRERNQHSEELKLLLIYVDDVVKTVK